jgi:parallel beta-helix repeat protein
MRNVKAVLILVGVVILAACGPATPAATPTPSRDNVTVMSDGSGDYDLLEHAVAMVEPGATITLGPGTYRLVYGLEIDKSITLIGAGMDETEIVSGAEDYVVRFDRGGSFTAKDITFRHDGNMMADVVVVERGVVDISGCRFTGAIYVEGEGNRAGLRLRGATSGIVEDNVFEDNDNTGLLLENQVTPTLERNVCSDNAVVGIGYMGTARGAARENECTDNAIGIAVAVEARPTLERNVCNDNDYGIAYLENGSGQAIENQCMRNKIGLVVDASASPEMVDNDCRDNTEEDIQDRRD